MALPDFLVIGSPKAGSTALHAALARHPQLYAAPVKEPKYFMCADAPPDPAHQRGPGDAHSAQEWVWRRPDYEQLFAQAPPGTLRFESTPFYLWDLASHRRMADMVPDAKLIAIIRDPVDRAFSNWTHLWSDGLEPEREFLQACELEPQRVAAGWAPFWRYLGLGRYGEQLAHLYRYFPADRVRIIRYRQLIDEPGRTLADLCQFLGVDDSIIDTVPGSNVTSWAKPGAVNDALRVGVRAGARVGAQLPPKVWRKAQRPLLSVLKRGSAERPRLSREQRGELVGRFVDDNALLGELLGVDYSDWLGLSGRGTYTVRRS